MNFKKNEGKAMRDVRCFSSSFFMCVMVVCFGLTGCNEEELAAFSDGERLRTVKASELAYFRLSDINWDSSYVYKVMDGNVQVGQVCREYLRTQDQELVAQAVVVYPMYRNKVDLSNGYIIQVNDADGSASTAIRHGGVVRWSATRNVIDYYREGEQTNVSDTVVYGGGGFGSPAGSCGCGYRLELEPDILVDKRGSEKQGYKLVKIAKQYWMQENLRAEYLNDGTEIPNISTSWASVIKPANCFANNDIGNKSIYGMLYNGYCIGTNKLAPIGYNVPSDSDWGILEQYLGIDNPLSTTGYDRGVDESILLKSISNYWLNDTISGNNLTGFSVLPGGIRSRMGVIFTGIGTDAYFWSSTIKQGTSRFNRIISINFAQISRMNQIPSFGMSVRCLRNE